MILMCCKKLLGGLICVLPSGHEGKCSGGKAALISLTPESAAIRTGKPLIETESEQLPNPTYSDIAVTASDTPSDVACINSNNLGRALAAACQSSGEDMPKSTEEEHNPITGEIIHSLRWNSEIPPLANISKREPTFSELYGAPAGESPKPIPPGAYVNICGAFSAVSEAIRADAEAPHVQLKALAGTGKTTSCVEGLKHVKGIGASVTPSPQQAEFWRQLGLGRNETVRLSAFNTSITDELKTRLQACALDSMGVEARGIHSLGNTAVYKKFGRMEATDWATKHLVCEVMGKEYNELKREKGMLTLLNAATELVSLCKQNLCEPTPEEIDRLASHYDVDVDKHMARVVEIVPIVLERSKSPKGRIHFDDMVWLPLVLDLPVPMVDVQIIDEQQDLNRMQQELVYRAGRRIVGVGDEHQAIYGFAGADAESMQRMAGTLAMTPRGCVELPLTVTRRCCKSVVREAQKYVPEFEAHESNPEGSVSRANYTTRKNPFTNKSEDVPYKETYMPRVRDGAMVLCRTNGPLVRQCFKFLKHGVKAQIQGKKIGEGLVALVDKSKIEDVLSFRSWLNNWAERELEIENNKKFPSQNKLDLIHDKQSCLLSFCEGVQRMKEVSEKIKSIFTDARAIRGVRLSSIHKSKGLEAEQVFFLQPPGVGVQAKTDWQRKQEDNLKYVATTRAISELVYVR